MAINGKLEKVSSLLIIDREEWLTRSSFNAIAFYLDIGGESQFMLENRRVWNADEDADMLAKEGF